MDALPFHIRPSGAVIGVALVTGLAVYIWRIYQWRLGFNSLPGNLKNPPFSMWLGSIPAMAKIYEESPTDTHPMTTLTLLTRKHSLGDMYYMDNWPASEDRFIVINDPELAAQAIQQGDLPKYHLYDFIVEHIIGKTSMIMTNGAIWKQARSLFNPGFAAGHLMTLIPTIVDDTLIYCKKLDQLAESGELIPMEESLSRLLIDVMGHVVLDHDLNAQTTKNELVAAFRGAVKWTPQPLTTNPFLGMLTFRQFWHWYYARQMNNYIRKVIEERIAQRSVDNAKKTKRKPAIDLAVDEYLSQGGDGRKAMDQGFQTLAIDQMKSFLFAGHDTSSTTICYVYHLLDLNPDKCEKIRKEHDEVFGSTKGTADKIKANPNLLNELPYTTAVIKETLRLFTPASTSREGSPSVTLHHNGVAHPTEGFMVWVNNHTIHRRADLFPSPDDFIPERFLPSSSPSSFQPQDEVGGIKKDAWRPFEKGNRGCIGQELAMLEMKVILALTCRKWRMEAGYEEWDAKLGRKTKEGQGEGKESEKTGGERWMFGYRAYPQMKATAKPSDGMPARVYRVEGVE